LSLDVSQPPPRPTKTQPAQAAKPSPPASPGKAAATRVREALRALIDLSGLSRREIERRLSQQGGGIDLTRLLTGRFEIKLRHLLDVAHVIGIHPLELFRLCFREPPAPSPLLVRVKAVFAPGRLEPAPRPPAAPPAAGDLQDLRRRVDQLAQLLAKLSAAAATPTDSAADSTASRSTSRPPPCRSRKSARSSLGIA
jgi:hypothetical protein